MRVLYKAFDSQFLNRERIMRMAAEFASELGPDRLINITHSEDKQEMILTVWYWETAAAGAESPYYPDADARPATGLSGDTHMQGVDADTMTDRPPQAQPASVPEVAGAWHG
jgi:hypothetical protein